MPEDPLHEYRRKRSFGETPEPEGVGGSGAKGAPSGRFVVQQHDATALHWDLRLEHGDAAASWALPRGIPRDPEEDRLAVRTEDHPLEYLEFAGTIPKGQYGAGEMTIWDQGTYLAEKFEDAKVVAGFDGERLRGRYSLFRIRKSGERADSWLIHRMDPAEPGWQPLPDEFEPMLATPGKLPADEEAWAYEVLWSGERVTALQRPGELVLRDRVGKELSGLPEVRRAARSLGHLEALLDGVLTVFDRGGGLDPERLGWRLAAGSDATARRRAREAPATLVLFDLVHLEGEDLRARPYGDRRELLAGLDLDGETVQAPAHHVGDGAALLEASRRRGLAGIVAKRRESVYVPGERSPDWIDIAAA